MGGGGINHILYEHSQAQQSPDYIHFLDSDDWLELDCIEECVSATRQGQIEIVWHNYRIWEYQVFRNLPTFSQRFGLSEGRIYSGLDVYQSLKTSTFSWAWSGMVAFDFLQKYSLRFQESIESEDALFGMQLFALASKIVMLEKALCVYRIRPNSISQHTLEDPNFIPSFPQHMQDIVQTFQTAYEIRHYHFAYSHCVICIKMDEFLKRYKNELNEELRKILISMVEHRAIFAFGALGFWVDPRDCRTLCQKIIPYSSKIRLGSRLSLHYPKLYFFLKRLRKILMRR